LPKSRTTRKKVTAYLGLGSNLGDRRQNLRRACEMLTDVATVNRLSPLYDTAPVGNTDQPRFLNAVCRVATDLSPEDLLRFIKDMEQKMGRRPGPPNSPRPIDIDILFYNDVVMHTPDLTIPHPRLAERAFVLAPLADIAPDLVHPVTGKTVARILVELERRDGDAVKTPRGAGD